MFHHYHDPATSGTLTLWLREPVAERRFFNERKTPLLSITWNRGPAQTVWVDEFPLTVPSNAIVSLMVSQTYRFDQPANVVLWRFNRDFYCIVDHDREVSCVGLLFYGSHGTTIVSPDVDDLRRLSTLLTVFDDEFQRRDTIQGEMLRTLLKRLIIFVTRLARANTISDTLTQLQLDVVQKLNLLVENSYRTLHRVREYASLMNKSPKTLANLIAANSERTPLQVIHERITIEAKRLLIYTDKGVKQIAGELGFADAATFSRFFKGSAGASPQDFRSARGGIAPVSRIETTFQNSPGAAKNTHRPTSGRPITSAGHPAIETLPRDWQTDCVAATHSHFAIPRIPPCPASTFRPALTSPPPTRTRLMPYRTDSVWCRTSTPRSRTTRPRSATTSRCRTGRAPCAPRNATW